MTVSFDLIFSTLLADLASRRAAGRLDADDIAVTAVLVALDAAVRDARGAGAGEPGVRRTGRLIDLAAACVASDREHGVPAVLVARPAVDVVGVGAGVTA
jgi:hypothetical protein